MIDIIKDSLVYDIGYTGGISNYRNLGYDIASSSGNTFASWYASKADSEQKTIDDFNRDYGGVKNIK